MKRISFFFVAVIAAVCMYAFQTNPTETLAIGAQAPKTDLVMKDISGSSTSLKELKNENGLLVIFSCNTCPFVVGSDGSEGWEGRYAELQKFADAHGVGMALINSNEAKREKGDNLEDMASRAKDHGFANCHYLLDANSELANAFYARTTPHVYLFDNDFKLVYKGSIDDNVDNSKKVSQPWLMSAMQNLKDGKPINPAETKPVGCSIKRAS